MVDSNPINKQQSERGLTATGREQVLRSAQAMRRLGVEGSAGLRIFYDSGARATQTAELLASELGVSRRDVEPEFRWLEARGFGALDGTDLAAARARVRALDERDIDNSPDPSEDGTPADSVNEIFSRMRNTVAKIESSFGGGDFVIVGGSSEVLSVFAAAACEADLREHHRFELPPGGFFDLRELVRLWKDGSFVEAEVPLPSDAEARRGRVELADMGPRLFSDTAAGACLCCACAR